MALAHPIRRRMVERLARGPATVGEASEGIPVSKPAITKHLRILEGAGVVSRHVVGRSHRLELNPDRLDEVASWIADQRAMWERKLDVVEEYLAEQAARGEENGT